MKPRHLHHTGGLRRDQDRPVSTTLMINTPNRRPGTVEGHECSPPAPAPSCSSSVSAGARLRGCLYVLRRVRAGHAVAVSGVRGS
ncbi:hypothetical protein DVA86_34990 [Streptomyces armeniacus]|uniref:Uncharacterized protein n=1 Tax=Streptomyces armeniacus TaxID=83291 RepID=A0A345XZ79_9ACTN|nr:hypothetical protein DVA86_34990 [Streptomyces armeniacus]